MSNGEALPLCLTCGLCCNGTVFPHAPLDDDETEAAVAAGLTPTSYYGRIGFSLPCPLLAGTLCTIYPDRPAICGRYSCETLKALEHGAITRTEADRRVSLALLAERHATAALPPGRTLNDARRRMSGLRADKRGPARAIVALEIVLDRYFREPPCGSPWNTPAAPEAISPPSESGPQAASPLG